MNTDFGRVQVLEKELQERDRQLAFQHRSLTALLAILEADVDQLTLDKVFARAVETVRQITGFETVVLRMYNDQNHSHEILAQHGMPEEMAEHMRYAPADIDNPPSEATRRRWPVWVRDLAHNRFLEDAPFPPLFGYHSVVSIPLLTESRVLGTMELATMTEYKWSESELAWLALLGRTIGSIIHQVQLADQIRNMATVEERIRLSREIHDGLVQTIGAICLWSENASDSLAQGDIQSAANAVDKIDAYARDAYVDLREEMVGLRNALTPEQDIMHVVQDYLNRFQRKWNIDSQLIIKSNGVIKSDIIESTKLTISPSIEIQLLRIIQEALTNVRRHAQASKVSVMFEQTSKLLQVSIEDNGKGFADKDLSGDSLGLKIMRERVDSISGLFKINNVAQGKGTCVVVTIPLSRQEEQQ